MQADARRGASEAGKPSVSFKLGARPGVPAVKQEDVKASRDTLQEAGVPQVPRDSHSNATRNPGGETQLTADQAQPGAHGMSVAGRLTQEGGMDGGHQVSSVPSRSGGPQGALGWAEDPCSTGGHVAGLKHERDGAGDAPGHLGDCQRGPAAARGSSQGHAQGVSRDRHEGNPEARGEVGEPPPLKKLKIKFKFPSAKPAQ